MHKFIYAAALTAVITTQAQAKEIALTFDDSPRGTGVLMTGMERAKKLTDQFEKNQIPQVAFFCNSPSRETQGPERLKHFADHGHIIANHSATHPDLTKTRARDYKKDISLAHSQLKNYPNYRNWFRYPYLHEGNTRKKRDSIRQYLKRKNWLNAYVTVDNADYYMDSLLGEAAAAGRKYDETKLCQAYRDMLAEEITFYDDISTRILGRSVRHVLLLHETDLNAICLSSLVSWLRENDWSIISPEDAYKDPIAAREPATMYLGQGRVAALAKEKGYAGPYISRWNSASFISEELERRAVFSQD